VTRALVARIDDLASPRIIDFVAAEH